MMLVIVVLFFMGLPVSLIGAHHTPYSLPAILKNGTIIGQKKIIHIMDGLFSMATSRHTQDTYALKALIEHCFEQNNNLTAHESILDSKQFLTAEGCVISEVKSIVCSAVDFDAEYTDLSLMRSPLKGMYLFRPLPLHQAKFASSSYLEPEYIPEKNLIRLILFNPNYLVPVSFEKKYKLDDEQEVDHLPYQDEPNFWQKYGFKTYEAYLNEVLSYENALCDPVKFDKWARGCVRLAASLSHCSTKT